MKMFIAFAAVLAVASAGLLPHHGNHHNHHSQQNSGYEYHAAASNTNEGYNYEVPAESRPQNTYLSPLSGAESRQVESVASAQPEIRLVNEKLHENNGLEGYQYSYELSDGQKKEETAELRNVEGSEEAVIVVRGSYTYVDPATNQEYTITYVADENGFQPEGAHIPRV